MNEKPIKCPICGDTDDVVVERKDCYGCELDYYVVKCDGCGLQFGFGLEFESEEEAVSAWNRRAQPAITGETSDGYHTFNELYHHRAVLFSVICNTRPSISWKSRQHHDGTMYDGMFIVGINTPDGPATYHYDVEPYWKMFRVPELPHAPEWDGHTPAQAIERIGKLSAQPANDPLICEGCEHKGKWETEYEYGYPSPCTLCARRAVDNYARKLRGEHDA